MNVYNILAAAAACYARNCKAQAIASGVAALTRVPGRFERVDCGQPFTVVVDYAHTDDALRNLTALAREFVSTRKAEGPSDHGVRLRRRPRSGQASADGRGRRDEAAISWCLTSDNPRSEDPLAIINDAMVGAADDRDRSTRSSPTGARPSLWPSTKRSPGDIVLIAGKGHEKVQVTREGSIPFDDVEVAREGLAGQRVTSAKSGSAAGRTRMKLPLSRIAEFISATGEFDQQAIAPAYSIDSRTIQAGELFFAVKGERLDGHDYVEPALEKGAVAAVVRKDQMQRYSRRERGCWRWTIRWSRCRRWARRCADCGESR